MDSLHPTTISDPTILVLVNPTACKERNLHLALNDSINSEIISAKNEYMALL
jgi:hypothetical protein